MTIDLTAIEQAHRDVEVPGLDEPVRVYQVSKPLIWRIKPERDKPRLPVIEMKLATGRVQRRAAKPGDPEFAAYQQDLAAWEEEQIDLQNAAGLVLALKDVRYPDDLDRPPPDTDGLDYPQHELLRKEFWLKATLLSRPAVFSLILGAMTELDGLEREVEAIKAGFRAGLSGDSAGGLEADGPQGDDQNPGQ